MHGGGDPDESLIVRVKLREEAEQPVRNPRDFPASLTVDGVAA